MRKKNRILPTVLGILLLAGGLITGTILVQQKQVFNQKAAPSTSLYMDPASLSKNPSDTFSLAVKVDTGSNAMTGFDLLINYNPAAVEVTGLEKGTSVANFTTQVLNSYDNTAGVIKFSYVTTDTTKAVTGSGLTVLTISARVRPQATAGTYDFTVDPSTMAIATGESQNILTGTSGATLTVVKVGDVNLDGAVNLLDIGEIIDHYRQPASSDPRADLNKDGSINLIDLGVVIDHYNQ